MTRDRVTYETEWAGRPFVVVDTGGWETDVRGLDQRVAEQAEVAVDLADAVMFVVDATVGATPPTRPSSGSCGARASRWCWRPTRSTTSAARHSGISGPMVKVEHRKSVDVGSVRLFERHIRSDPPSAAEMSVVTNFRGDQLSNDPTPPRDSPRGHGWNGDHDRRHCARVEPYDPGPYPRARLTGRDSAAAGQPPLVARRSRSEKTGHGAGAQAGRRHSGGGRSCIRCWTGRGPQRSSFRTVASVGA